MLPGGGAGFALDGRIEAASRAAMWLGLCELRVMDERRWPWVILIPQRPGMRDMHDLTPLDQAMLTFEISMVAKALKTLTECETINIGSVSNDIPHLHVHLVARSRGDEGWPTTVWDSGPQVPWERAALRRFIDRLRAAI